MAGARTGVDLQAGLAERFAARLQQATLELPAGRPDQAIEACRRILHDTDSSPDGPVATRGAAYRLILHPAEQLPLTSTGFGTRPPLFHGSSAANRLLREERRAYGVKVCGEHEYHAHAESRPGRAVPVSSAGPTLVYDPGR